MKVVALVSGGKDSCFSMHLCGVHGHQVVALANLLPPDSGTDELDSYMYQTVGHQLVAAYAACTGLPLYRARIHGASTSKGLSYSCTAGDEVEDLTSLLTFVKERHPEVQAVASGAIASNYQRLRVESVCSRLGLVSLGYLWHQPQDKLLSDMISNNIEAVLVKVAAIGLDPYKHLGKSIRQMQPLLRSLRDRFGCNVCGEGGEYETLTLDCPAFKHGRIVLSNWQVVLHSPDSIAPVGVLHPTAFHIEHKQQGVADTDAAAGSQTPNHQQQHKATVVEVPHDWQPAQQSAKAAGAGSSSEAAETWSTTLQATVSPAHIHITCCASAKQQPGAGGIPKAATAAAAAADVGSGSGFTAADTAGALGAALSAVAAQLPGQGLTWMHSCFVHLYLADMAHFGSANEVYCRHLPQVDPPSRACVQTPLPAGCPVLLDVLFARPLSSSSSSSSSSRQGSDLDADATAAAAANPVDEEEQQQQRQSLGRHVLHVQSISSWAPSCIGPYSQATACNGLIYMAGQIPLDPASMAIAAPSPAGLQHTVAAQAWRTLRSCQAVAVAVRSCFASAALGLTVYLSEACEAAGGQAIVLAALQAVWADSSLLDCLGVPPAVLQAAAEAAGAAGACAAVAGQLAAHGGPLGSGSRSSGGSSGSAEEEESDDATEGAGFVDDYLRPPVVTAPLRPAVVFVTVPGLPRGALLEVQPVLKDLAAAAPRASSISSGSDSDDEQEAAAAGAAAQADAQPDAGTCTGGSPAVAAEVHITCNAGRSSWRRILVHILERHAADETGCSCDSERVAQAAAAGKQLVAALQQRGGGGTGAASVCSLRCWCAAATGGVQGMPAWQDALVSAVRQGLGPCQQQVAVQIAPVSKVATEVQPGACWAVVEAYIEP